MTESSCDSLRNARYRSGEIFMKIVDGKDSTDLRMARKQAQSEWSGVIEKHLYLLQQHLCRCGNRYSRFGGDDLAIASAGTVGMMGKVVKVALDYVTIALRAEIRSVISEPDDSKRTERFAQIYGKEARVAERLWEAAPTQRDLAARLALNASVVGRFLQGDPSKGTTRAEHAEAMLRFLMLGSGEASPERQAIAGEVIDYFFGDSKYFKPRRRCFSDPCSRSELADELRWLARQARLWKEPSRLVWVSSARVYFGDVSEEAVSTAVRLILEAGVAVDLVSFDPEAESINARNLRSLLQHAPRAKQNARSLYVDAIAGPSFGGWSEFACPSLQFLYMLSTSRNQKQEEVYILRGYESDEDRREAQGPVAWEANKSEREPFIKWLARLDAHLASSQTESSESMGPDSTESSDLESVAPRVSAATHDRSPGAPRKRGNRR